ncbi:MAG: HNH endonuclease [Nocardioidaceae bacterium]
MNSLPVTVTADLRDVVTALGRLSPGDDADRIDALRLLEELKAAAAGAQARITVTLADSQRAAQEAAGEPDRQHGRGIAAQVALARRESPFRGARHLGLARALVELPRTAAALSRGELSEWRATLMARETACLSREDRGVVDAELAARRGGLGSLGDRAVEQETRRIAYRLDPHAFARRAAKAEGDRRVTVRPAPDTMALVTGLLPMRQGVAVYAALTRHADSLRSSGDERSRGQIMADTLVERVTGQATASAVPIEVNVVMTDAALLGDDSTPAQVPGFGPVPAPFARHWLSDPEAAGFARRLYTAPSSHQLVAMDSSRRGFAGGLRAFVGLRDQICRTPWCDAPIRHIDHPRRVADGGETSAANGQGLCEACNQAKEAVGWSARGSGTSVETVTPTGHSYLSRPPPLVPPATGDRPPSRMELHFADLILVA